MGLEDYAVCVPLPDGDMLCFNRRTRGVEIVAVKSRPADLETVSKDALMKLKDKLDALPREV